MNRAEEESGEKAIARKHAADELVRYAPGIQSEKAAGLKRAAIMVVILVALALGGTLVARSLGSHYSGDPNQYRVTDIKRDTVKKTVTATGTLSAWTTVDVKSKAGGEITLLAVDEGSKVKAGTLIAKIDPADTTLTYRSAKADVDAGKEHVTETERDLKLQKDETLVTVDTAKASLVSARAAAASAKARMDQARSQAEVQEELTAADINNAKANLAAQQAKMNQLKSASNPQNRAAAEGALHQAEANLLNSEAQLKRQKALLAKGFVSQSAVDDAQATYGVAKATVESTREKFDTIEPELETDIAAQQAAVSAAEAAMRTSEANRVNIKLKKQSLDQAVADYNQAVATVTQAEVKAHEAEVQRINDDIRQSQLDQARATVDKAEANIVNAKINLDQTTVRAPSDGVVLKKYLEQGTIIQSALSFASVGTAIVQMGDISRMYVDVEVDETDVAAIDMDQKVDITFDAYGTTPFEGKVIKINPQATVDQNVTTVHVRVEVDNTLPSYRLLKPGMNATCEFVVDKKDDAVSVPNESLRTDADGTRYVEVVRGGKPATPDEGGEPDPTLLVDITKEKRKLTADQIGLEGNDNTEVLGGLKEGEKIVTQTIEPSTSSGNPFSSGKGPGKK